MAEAVPEVPEQRPTHRIQPVPTARPRGLRRGWLPTAARDTPMAFRRKVPGHSMPIAPAAGAAV
jgi:hypothetical protein